MPVKPKIRPATRSSRKEELNRTRPSESADTSSLSLPKRNGIPLRNLSDFTYLFYGERKIGKTTIFSQFEDPFFLMFEPGAKALSIRERFCSTWEHFLAYLDLLEKNPKYCKTVVIDTGHGAYERCFDYVCRSFGVEHPTDINTEKNKWEASKVWKAIEKEFISAHNRIADLDVAFAVTAHSTLREVKRRDGSIYDKLTIELGSQAFKFYAGVVDVIGYYQYNIKSERVLTIAGDDMVEAGSRVKGHFRYNDGSPIVDIPMGQSEEQAYRNLELAFNNKLKKEGGKKLPIKKKV